MKTPSQKICPAEQHTAAGPAGECAACKKRSNINYNIYLYASHRALEKKQKIFEKYFKKGLAFSKTPCYNTFRSRHERADAQVSYNG